MVAQSRFGCFDFRVDFTASPEGFHRLLSFAQCNHSECYCQPGVAAPRSCPASNPVATRESLPGLRKD